jgi:hypothetical protein
VNPSKNPFSPIVIFANSAMAARFWFMCFCFASVLAVLGPFAAVQAMKQREKLIVLPQDGSILYANSKGFWEGDDLAKDHGRRATFAVLTRNPAGPDAPEDADRLFLEPARAKLKRYWKGTQGEFAEKQIFQNAVINRFRVQKQDSIGGLESCKVTTYGQVIRNATIQGVPVTETTGFAAEFIFVRNPDLMKNGRLPLAVHDFTLNDHLPLAGAKP